MRSMMLRTMLILHLLVSSTALAAGAPGLSTAPAAASATTPSNSINVLFVGNSLSYVNDLPALFSTLAMQQPGRTAYHADLIAAPGGTIAERWKDGVAAGLIADGNWQVLVLQEKGGLLACMAKPAQRNEPECAASLSAHKKFAKLAGEHDIRVIVLGTWGPDAIWQGQLSRGLRKLADNIGARAVDAGPVVRAYGNAHEQTPMYTDAVLHPTLDASLLMAIELYLAIDGEMPAALALEINSPLLPSRAMVLADQLLSTQKQLAGDGTITRIDLNRMQSLVDAVAADPQAKRDE